MSRDDLPLTGIVNVTGEQDTGKTTFAYTVGVPPAEIAFFDNDLKAEEVHRQLRFGVYHNLVREFRRLRSGKPIDFFNMTMGLVEELPEDRFSVLVFDNWTQMEEGINSWVDEHITEVSNLTMGQVKSASPLTWPYKRLKYAAVLDALLSKAPLVIITVHVKDQWMGMRKTGLKEARCQQPLVEKSALRLWLRHNPDSQAPIGLVLKRIAVSRWNPETGLIEVGSVLPRRFAPCTWERIRWYFNNPVGNRKLNPDEIPTEYELSILDGTLTKDQKMMLELAMKSPESDFETAEPAALPDDGLTGRIMELRAQGLKAPAIVKELREQGVSVSMTRVLEALNAQ